MKFFRQKKVSIEVDLILKYGLRLFGFGIEYQKASSLINEDEQYEQWMGGNLNDSILLHGLILRFDSCDSNSPLPNSKFNGYEVCGRSNATVMGKIFSEITPEFFVDMCSKQGIDLYENWGEDWLWYYEVGKEPECGLAARFESGVLSYLIDNS